MRRLKTNQVQWRVAIMFSSTCLMYLAGACSDPIRAATSATAASTVANGDEALLSEVIVVAEKSPARLQTTPIAMSVLGAGDLDNRHIQSLGDLNGGSVPAVMVAPFFTRSSALLVAIRGIGVMSDANQGSRDQGVGVYLDGVYLGRAQGLGAALVDIDRIEISKGPQGTLFGRNSEGGAIDIVSRAPSGEFGVDALFGFGNYGAYRAQMHVNLPTVESVSVKMDGVITARDGTVRNPLAGQQNFNAYDRRGASIEARWSPSSDFTATYAYDRSHDGSTPYYAQMLFPGPVRLSPLVTFLSRRAGTADFEVPLRPSVGEIDGHRLTLEWSRSPALEIKSISAYRKLSQSQFDDGETVLSAAFSPSTPTASFGRYSLANLQQHALSEELQLLGTFHQVSYVSGLYLYEEFVHDNAWTPNPLQWSGNPYSYSVLAVPASASPFPDRASRARTTSVAAFGQLTWTPMVADGSLHFTMGARATSDHKSGSLDLVNGAVPVINASSGSPIVGAIPLDKTWRRIDPLLSVGVDLSPDVFSYAKWGTGYRAGGANSRSYTFRAFDPESVSMLEVGLKSEFLGHRARFNVAAYEGEIRNSQVDFLVVFNGNNNRGTTETTNARGVGHTKGVEVEMAFIPAPGLTVGTSLTHTSTSLPPAANPFAANALVPAYGQNTPNSANISVDYVRHHPGVDWAMHLDGTYADGNHTIASDSTVTDPSMVINARLSLTGILMPGLGRFETAIWARNLLDEQHTFYKTRNPAIGTYGIFNEPRTVGMDASLRF